MLVNEDRHYMAAVFEDPDRLLPEPAFGILRVAGGRFGIFPVLGDEQDAIHRQPAGPERERIFNRLAQPKPMRGGEQPADVAGGPLVRVKRNELERRILPFAIQRVGLKQPAEDHIRV